MPIDQQTVVLPGDLYDGLGTTGNGTPYATLGRDGIIAALQKYGNFNVDRGLSKGDYWLVNEKIVSGYVQANFESGAFRGNVGGRYVFTRDTSNFFTQSGGIYRCLSSARCVDQLFDQQEPADHRPGGEPARRNLLSVQQHAGRTDVDLQERPRVLDCRHRPLLTFPPRRARSPARSGPRTPARDPATPGSFL